MVEPCCWMTYTTHRDTQATLQILDRAEMDASECTDVELYKRFGLDEKYEDNELSCWQRVRPKIWATFEVPHSSLAAKVSACQTTSRKAKNFHETPSTNRSAD
uniref:Uncharacterized protein n=1 Tax=Mesocestoides corti TaxID=53468 RepID=A0A5K3FVR5_MESCO